ncbi:hypothetical protein CDIK_2954 [Cucumispora dikerogammari]|nr:hypothetical protein CDIK_2954 [Cucumispora dikerogammari]
MEITKILLNTARLLNLHTLNTSQDNQHVRDGLEIIGPVPINQTIEHLSTSQDLPPSYESAMKPKSNVLFLSENPPSYNETINSNFQVLYSQSPSLSPAITNTERESSVPSASENSSFSRISYSLHSLRTLCKPFNLLKKCFEECTTTLCETNDIIVIMVRFYFFCMALIAFVTLFIFVAIICSKLVW